MKRAWLGLFLVLLFVITINIVSARFQIDDNKTIIEKNYFDGEFVSGRISMNFSEQINSMFESNFDGGISLVELLKEMSYVSGEDFECQPSSCGVTYKTGDGEEGRESLEAGVGKSFGFKLEGDGVEEIENLTFSISAINDAPSCDNQVTLDLFGDGKIDFYNTHYSQEGCFKSYGCFKEDSYVKDIEPNIRSDSSYCERIDKIPPAPAYKIGVKAKKINENAGPLVINFYKIDSDNRSVFTGSCDISGNNFTVNTLQEAGCIAKSQINLFSSFESFNAFVCVKATKGNEYKIRSRDGAEDSCGGEGNPSENEIEMERDYEIFAQAMSYSSVGNGVINSKTYQAFTGRDLFEDAVDYLTETYGDNCGDGGCVIPIEVNGSLGVNANNGFVEYITDGQSFDDNKIYLLEKSEPLISTQRFLDLDVEKMKFEVPNSPGEHDFKLEFDGFKIAEEEIEIEKGFEFNVGPRFALLGRQVSFRIFGAEISSSKWDFGDGSAGVNSNSDSAAHVYSEQGEFNLKVSATNSSGSISVKIFPVIVGDPKTSAAKTITDYKERIVNIKDEISAYPTWVKTKLEEETEIAGAEHSLSIIEEDYELLGQNAEDEEYMEIVERLIELDVPFSISTIESGSLPIDVGFENIDLTHIGEISRVEAGDRNEIIGSLVSWLSESYDVSIRFENIASFRDSGEKIILKKYEIELRKKIGASVGTSYLIINVPVGSIKMGSSQQPLEISSSSATYFVINGESDQESIEFLIVGETAPEILELGAYLSPSLTELGTSGKPYGGFVDQEGNFRWGLFIIAMIILFIVFLGAYVFLQSWYKRYYEKHLFNNPDDLYNLINFIYNSRKSEIGDNETKEKLKGRKWSKEQITYVFRKIDGKRTGMWEIPLFKFVENKKVKEEIERRQGAPVDARFISQRRGFVTK